MLRLCLCFCLNSLYAHNTPIPRPMTPPGGTVTNNSYNQTPNPATAPRAPGAAKPNT